MTDNCSPDHQKKCFHCGKTRSDHRAVTYECPRGRKSKIGYTSFGPKTFTLDPVDNSVKVETIEQRIEAFRLRVEKERALCEELFRHLTVRLLASKYAYYVESNPYQSDAGYDSEEKDWYTSWGAPSGSSRKTKRVLASISIRITHWLTKLSNLRRSL